MSQRFSSADPFRSTAPDLVVGDIEIRGGSIRIGNLEVQAPTMPPANPSVPPSFSPAFPTIYPEAGPGVSPMHVSPLLPANSTKISTETPVTGRRVRTGDLRHAATESPAITAKLDRSPRGIGYIEPLVRDRGPLVRVGEIRLMALLAAIFVAAMLIISWSSWFESTLVGFAIVGGVSVIGTGFVVIERRKQERRQLERKAFQHQLIARLAEKNGGRVGARDLVLEAGLTYAEADELLTQLAVDGHSVPEFDPQRSIVSYRVR